MPSPALKNEVGEIIGGRRAGGNSASKARLGLGSKSLDLVAASLITCLEQDLGYLKGQNTKEQESCWEILPKGIEGGQTARRRQSGEEKAEAKASSRVQELA